MNRIIFALLIGLSTLQPLGITPQETMVTMAPATVPVDPTVTQAVQDYLENQPPSEATVYAITSISLYGTGYAVSVVGLTGVTAPYDDWSLEDGGQSVWTGTIIVDDGPTRLFEVSSGGNCHDCSILPAGGGPEIYFPWQPGAKMYYGVRAVHGDGDYGTSGMLAVDWVGGDQLGEGVAPPSVYASYDGQIDYVCNDGTSMAIKVTDGGDNIFVYAHLVIDTALIVGVNFSRGDYIGELIYGSFNDTCGWASQKDSNYHLHWMFKPNNGFYQAEGWVLNTSSENWVQGDRTIAPTEWMVAGGVGTDLEDDPIVSPGDSNGNLAGIGGQHFWDYIVLAVYRITLGIADAIFPKREVEPLLDANGNPIVDDNGNPVMRSSTWISGVVIAIQEVTRIANILLPGMLNMTIFFIALGIFFVSEGVYFLYAMWRFILKIIPMAQ